MQSLLKRSGLPRDFWAEAVRWTIHILNKCPTNSIQNLTPNEARRGRKPNVEYFRFFGCIAYAHIPDAERKKMDDKGQKCIFLGLSDKSKAYCLFNPITKKIVISREIIFDEEGTRNWSNNKLFQQFPFSIEEEEKESEPPHESSSKGSPTVQTDEGVEHESGDAQPNNERPQCSIDSPSWMENYEAYGIRKSGNTVSHFSLFSDYDPISFTDAVKDPKWQQVMD